GWLKRVAEFARIRADAPRILANSATRLRNPPTPKRRWLVAAALLVLVGGGLGLTEAAGVTGLAAAVLRVFTPAGLLVVEGDGAEVKVTGEGEGGLVITGAGPQEVRLRPGSYRLLASKDGKVVREELVTITRGDRRVVTVSRESGGATPVAATVAPRFFVGHTGAIRSLAIAPDGRRALSASADQTVRLWDVLSGQELRCFKGHTDEVTAVAFAPDGREAASGGRDRCVRLWDVQTGEARGCWRGHTDDVTSVACGNGRLVSGGRDGTVRLWGADHPEELRTFSGHLGWVSSVAISPDGNRILSGGYDSTVRVWDAQSGKELHRLEGHTQDVYTVALSAPATPPLSAANAPPIVLS